MRVVDMSFDKENISKNCQFGMQVVQAVSCKLFKMPVDMLSAQISRRNKQCIDPS